MKVDDFTIDAAQIPIITHKLRFDLGGFAYVIQSIDNVLSSLLMKRFHTKFGFNFCAILFTKLIPWTLAVTATVTFMTTFGQLIQKIVTKRFVGKDCMSQLMICYNVTCGTLRFTLRTLVV